MAENIAYIYTIIDKFSPAMQKMVKASSAFQRGMQKTSQVAAKVGQKLNTFATAAGAIGGAIGGKMVLDKFVSFDSAMNKLESVTFATGDQMAKMRDVAKELGASTQFTAGQAAEGMTYLAMAGMDTKKVVDAIRGTLQLAAAGGLELGQAADIATNVLGQMGMQVEDLAHVNNVLALAQSKANFNITELFEAMRPIGTTAKNLGVSLEELTSYLGAMANAGEKGSIAGTLLRNAFTEIAGAGKEQKMIYKALGINLSDFVNRAGKITNFKGLIEQLQRLDKQGKLTVPILQKLYGDRGFRAIQVLVGSSTKELAKFEKQLIKSDNAAAKAAAIQMKGLPGVLKSMSSAFESLNIAIMESGLDQILIDIGKSITEFARAMSTSNPEMLKMIGIAGAIVAALGPVMMIVGMMMPAISAIASAIGALLSPVGLALIGVGAAIYQVWKNWDYLVQDFKAGFEFLKNFFAEAFALTPISALLKVIKGDFGGLIDDLKGAFELAKKAKGLLGFGPKEETVDEKIARVKLMRRERGVAAENTIATKSTLNGNITVAPAKGAKVQSAKMKTNVPGNLGFNIAGATP